MASWYRLDAGLVRRGGGGLLSAGFSAHGLLQGSGSYGREEVTTPRDGYVVSFAHFHEHGLRVPPHPFFWGLLHHYQIEPQLERDLANRDFHHIVLGIPGDRTPLQALEVFLCHLLGQEEGWVNGLDRLRWNPPSQTSGPQVHGHHHHEIQ
jgi:hypothetical protein